MPIFYTLQVNNTSGDIMPLTFDVKLQRPLFENPSEYSVGVVRFSIPNYNTPIFTFVDNAYTMTMFYNGSSLTQSVTYIPQNNVPNSRDVYEIQPFIVMLNTTISTLFSALNAVHTLPTTNIPYFTYNEVTKLISYITDSKFISSNSTPIILYVNQNLFQMLQGFPVFYSSSLGFQFLVTDQKNNNVPTGFYTMTQQASSFALMSDFTGIIFTTSMPILNEFTGLQLTGSNSGVLQQVSIPILQDYVYQELTVGNFHENIVYNAIVPYRQCKLTTNSPFYEISIRAYIMKVDGNPILVAMPPSSSANIKLMFTKNNENNYA